MAKYEDYAPFELMAAAAAREVSDGEIVAVGLGLPVVATFLAKRTHAPNTTILLELGVVNPEPIDIGQGLSDPRFWYRATCHTSFADMLGRVLHKGLVDIGFLGGLEIDQFGNLNTTLLGDPKGKFRRFTGSGGGNDIASCARRTVIIIRHEKRKINKAVSFITSPGYLGGDDQREQFNLRGGPGRLITDKAIFGFDPESKQMILESIHPNTTLEDVLLNMSFEPIVPSNVNVTETPTAEQVRLIRKEIDPQNKYAG